MKYIRRIICSVVIFAASNLPLLTDITGERLLWACLLGTLFLQVLPVLKMSQIPLYRHKICAGGCELLIYFILSLAGTVGYMLIRLPVLFSKDWWLWLLNLLCCILVEGLTFWNGIIRIYATSAQIGVKWRIIGILCGWIPLVNLFVLGKIIIIASCECKFESDKILENKRRIHEKCCKTKYPILMVHGVFFRDFRYLNYWGRIPGELEKNGACVYYGNHQSAASVENSARELAARIFEIVQKTGCEKVNIIAHSKGGLDCRYAISHLGMEAYVASLTTINTPHRGCVFADYLLHAIPQSVKDKVAKGYNKALQKLGDTSPDFMAAVTELTASSCDVFNRQTPNVQGVYYQSVGSKLDMASEGRFPLNFSHGLVKYFDGPNDGLVAENSFPWGERFTFLTSKGKRGISHGDMIDLNRENIKGFDVREFYVKLVEDLKKRGF